MEGHDGDGRLPFHDNHAHNLLHFSVVLCTVHTEPCALGVDADHHVLEGLVFAKGLLQAKLLNYFLGSNKSNINQMYVEIECKNCKYL